MYCFLQTKTRGWRRAIKLGESRTFGLIDRKLGTGIYKLLSPYKYHSNLRLLYMIFVICQLDYHWERRRWYRIYPTKFTKSFDCVHEHEKMNHWGFLDAFGADDEGGFYDNTLNEVWRFPMRNILFFLFLVGFSMLFIGEFGGFIYNLNLGSNVEDDHLNDEMEDDLIYICNLSDEDQDDDIGYFDYTDEFEEHDEITYFHRTEALYHEDGHDVYNASDLMFWLSYIYYRKTNSAYFYFIRELTEERTIKNRFYWHYRGIFRLSKYMPRLIYLVAFRVIDYFSYIYYWQNAIIGEYLDNVNGHRFDFWDDDSMGDFEGWYFILEGHEFLRAEETSEELYFISDMSMELEWSGGMDLRVDSSLRWYDMPEYDEEKTFWQFFLSQVGSFDGVEDDSTTQDIWFHSSDDALLEYNEDTILIIPSAWLTPEGGDSSEEWFWNEDSERLSLHRRMFADLEEIRDSEKNIEVFANLEGWCRYGKLIKPAHSVNDRMFDTFGLDALAPVVSMRDDSMFGETLLDFNYLDPTGFSPEGRIWGFPSKEDDFSGNAVQKQRYYYIMRDNDSVFEDERVHYEDDLFYCSVAYDGALRSNFRYDIGHVEALDNSYDLDDQNYLISRSELEFYVRSHPEFVKDRDLVYDAGFEDASMLNTNTDEKEALERYLVNSYRNPYRKREIYNVLERFGRTKNFKTWIANQRYLWRCDKVHLKYYRFIKLRGKQTFETTRKWRSRAYGIYLSRVFVGGLLGWNGRRWGRKDANSLFKTKIQENILSGGFKGYTERYPRLESVCRIERLNSFKKIHKLYPNISAEVHPGILSDMVNNGGYLQELSEAITDCYSKTSVLLEEHRMLNFAAYLLLKEEFYRNKAKFEGPLIAEKAVNHAVYTAKWLIAPNNYMRLLTECLVIDKEQKGFVFPGVPTMMYVSFFFGLMTIWLYEVGYRIEEYIWAPFQNVMFRQSERLWSQVWVYDHISYRAQLRYCYWGFSFRFPPGDFHSNYFRRMFEEKYNRGFNFSYPTPARHRVKWSKRVRRLKRVSRSYGTNPWVLRPEGRLHYHGMLPPKTGKRPAGQEFDYFSSRLYYSGPNFIGLDYIAAILEWFNFRLSEYFVRVIIRIWEYDIYWFWFLFYNGWFLPMVESISILVAYFSGFF